MSQDEVIAVDRQQDPDRFFWDACAKREFWVQRCRACDQWQYYPRAICSHCWSRDLEWRRPSGHAVLETFSVVQRGAGEFSALSPYVVALVTLDEGPRMMTNIDVANPDDLEIGMRLHVAFRNQNDRVVPVFTVA